MEQRYYIAEHLNKDVCRKSSSGGMFTAITDAWFQMHGDRAVVYGCVLDENLKAKHVRAVNRDQRDAMRGSKYIGSDMSGVMCSVADDLQNGYYVAFSGTPCQVAGLNAVAAAKKLDKDYLLTIEVLCHGVGSVRFFNDYIAEKERKYRSKAVSCSFRGKRRRGKKAQMVVGFENGREYEAPSAKYDSFMAAYYQNYSLKPACFRCRYASEERHADVTIADFWEKASESGGVMSTVLVNTEKGMSVFADSEKNILCREVERERILQPHMKSAAKMPEGYEAFWDAYRNTGYAQAQKFLGLTTPSGRIRSLAAEAAYKMHADELIKKLLRK